MNKKKIKSILIAMFLIITVLTSCNVDNTQIENSDTEKDQNEIEIDINEEQTDEINLVDDVQEKKVFDVPDYILNQAYEQIESYYEESLLNFSESEYSDWRIENLKWSYSYDDLEGMKLDIYQINFEFFTEAPEKIVMAGGMYITEDNWVCPTYPNCTYLVFDSNSENMNKNLLFAIMENDCFPGDEVFTSDLIRVLSTREDNMK